MLFINFIMVLVKTTEQNMSLIIAI